jgi:hypothetical protein
MSDVPDPSPEVQADPSPEAQADPSAEVQAALRELEELAATRWTKLPGEAGRTVPTTDEGLSAMEEAVGRLAPLATEDGRLVELIALFARTCVWARRPRFVGNWGTVVGAAVAVLVLIVVGRRAGPPYLAAALVWTGAIPMYIQAAVAPQFAVNARVLSGHRTLDDRFLAFVASGAPLMTPLWLTLRAAVYGLAAPLLVLVEASRRGRYLPGVVMALVVTVAVLWAMTRDVPPLAEPEPEVTPAPVEQADWAPRLDVGDSSLVFGEPLPAKRPGGAALQLQLRATRTGALDQVVVQVTDDADAPDPEPVWGPPEVVDDRSASDCVTVLRTFRHDGLELMHRRSRCAGDERTVHEYTLR